MALNSYDSIEYLYCGHNKIVAFRFEDGQVDFVAVNSTDEAVALTQESGQSALPLQVPA
jgi:hypothetical protein